MKKVLVGLVTVAFAATVWADSATWYANCENTGAQDGKSEATGFVKIQDAVAAASAGDTIVVLPGVYGENQGTTDDYTADDGQGTVATSRSRVVVDKPLTLKSRDGVDATHIVGRWHQPGVPVGADAVRCVAIKPDGVGTVVEGFTIRDGATFDMGNYAPSYGGGILGTFNTSTPEPALQTFVVDCVVSNCCCSRGGAMAYASAVRTLFVRNLTTSNYILRNANAYNCVFLYNALYKSSAAMGFSTSTAYYNAVMGDYTYAVNCTFVGNGGPALANPSIGAPSKCTDRGAYNCFAAMNGGDGQAVKGADGDVAKVWNSVVNGTMSLDAERKVVSLGVDDCVVFDPAGGDFRPVADCAAVGTGDLAHLEKIPAAYRDTDFCGNPRTTAGRLNCGAVEATAVRAGGRMLIAGTQYAGAIAVNGRRAKFAPPPCAAWLLLAGEWPAQAEIGFENPEGAELFGWVQSGAWALPRFSDERNLTRFTFPPAGFVVTNTIRVTARANVFYADPNPDHGSDEYDGTCDFAHAVPDLKKGPKLKLQDAVNAATANGKDNFYVVHAAEGVYDQGEAIGAGWTNRLLIGQNRVLVRGAGRDKSFIKGRRDTSETGEANHGCGPGAIRCVAMSSSSYHSCVAGFTLVDGCVMNGATSASSLWCGGGFYAQSGDAHQLVDCTVTNCAGSRGGAMLYGWWQRCLVTGNFNETSGNTIYRGGRATSCIFRDNGAPGSYYFSNMSGAYHCVFDENLSKRTLGDKTEYTRLYDNIMHKNASSSTAAAVPAITNAWFGGNFNDSGSATGWTYNSKLMMVDPDGDDYRPLATSPLMTGGAVGSTGDETNYCAYAFEDYRGRTLCFVEGKPIVGAFQRPVYTVRPTGVAAGDIAPAGDVLMEEGDTASFTAPNASTGPRQFLGYAENGVPVAPGVTNIAYSLTKPLYDQPTVELKALYNTNWYVNADAAFADANDGWTPTSARHTLAAAVRDAVPGDVVHAAAGVYAEGAATNAAINTHGARVVLTNGVTLVGDEGAERTVILGQEDLTSGDQYHRGPNALRCVTMEGNARLVGFTLTGGRDAGGSASAAPNQGGGVWASTRDSAVVDCIVSNNIAIRFGGGYSGSFVRCRFLNNRATSNGNAGGSSSYYGCYFDGNNGHAWVINSPNDVIGCTITANNANIANGDSSRTRYIDTICLVKTRTSNNSADAPSTNAVVSNCVLAAKCNLFGKVAMGDNQILETDEIVVDADGVPVLNGKAIDCGVTLPGLCGHATGFDLNGTQRVYNGLQDVGAVERDWREDYTRRIGGGVTVVAASPEVVDSADGVKLPGGELTIVLADDLGVAKYRTSLAVTGTGSLKAYVNDAVEPACIVTKGASDCRLRAQGGNRLRFAYEPGAADEGYALIKGFGRPGFCVIIR